MITALTAAKEFFDAAIGDVPNSDLQHYVMRRTGQTRDVVHGTLDCTGTGTLIDCEWYTSRWYKDRLSNGRTIHRRHVGGSDITSQREMNFDFPMKRLACNRIMQHLPTSGSPRLLTLASASGNCVQEAVLRNPNVQIHNVECRQDVLNLWKAKKHQLGVESVDYLCKFQDFVNAPGFPETYYAIINADVMGYACKAMHEYLGAINRVKNTDIVAITTQCLNEFRNHGEFQDRLRAKYAGSVDKHAECIADWLPDYEMIDRFDYQKDEHSTRMEVFIFKLAAA
jgi:hypothetical protein